MHEPVIVVCIATKGRPDILTCALRQVARQTRAPDEILVCPSEPADIDAAALRALGLTIRTVAPSNGLTAQRNSLLREAGAADIVLFIDDDFLMSERYVEAMAGKFLEVPSIVCLTGEVLADGATTAGIAPDDALAILRDDRHARSDIAEVYNAYGCNMAFRWSRLRDVDCWFDETLPLYGWLEDVDFSRRAAAFGVVVKFDAMRGVHLGVKHGRISGVRFGYSQIANQIYLVRKGSNAWPGAARKVVENMLANIYGIVRGNDRHIDRRGRLKGNLIALFDGLVGRSNPQRVLDL